MYKILLIGCGELGSRFLQSLLQLKIISQIDIVEPNETARLTALERIMNIDNQIHLNWHKDINNCLKPGDLALITTHADVRFDLYKKVIEIGYNKIILEKIVTQNISKYDEMLNLSTKNNVNVWVNCKTRAYPIWEYIKSKISINDKIQFNSIGGNHGLCTNGLHTMDLFVYLTSSTELTCFSEYIDKDIVKTKRGKYDLSGDIMFHNSKGSKLSLQYNKDHFGFPLDIITTNDYRWVVDNVTKQAYESNLKTNNVLQSIPFEGNLMVSEMTKDFVNDIFNEGNCKLPSLKDCYISHKILFETYLPIFNYSLNKNDDICPIT